MRSSLRVAFCLLLSLLASVARADDGTAVPAKDVAGLKDPAGLARYKDAVLLLREDVDYDELTLPSGPAKYGRTADDSQDTEKLKAVSSVQAAGRRTRLMYATPAGRSGLEVVRNYQAQFKTQGYETVYECNADACGDGLDAFVSTSINFANFLLPRDQWKSTESSPQGCAVGLRINDVRYLLMKNATSGEVMALFTHSPDIVSTYCNEKAWQARVIATVAYVKPKGIEQSMVKLSADDMSKVIADTGRVALYGILFDTAKAEIKPASKPALDEIAKLLTKDTALSLHVVGHTDDQGKLEANFDLSKRRAEAVKAALVKTYGIKAERLTANGVASLAPVATNGTEEGRAKNRRVELVPF